MIARMLSLDYVYSCSLLPPQICHQKKSQLELLKNMPILLEFKLSSSITLEAVNTRADIFSNGARFVSKTIQPGKTTPIYLSALNDDK